MDHLVEGVLAVGAGLAPEDGRRIPADLISIEHHVLAVRLHLKLLQVGREARHLSYIRKDRDRREVHQVAVPNADEAHQDRHVLFQRSAAQMLIDGVEASQHLGEVLAADRAHDRQADRAVHRVAAANPIPEAEHVVGVDAEFGYAISVG